ncbi:hypothetical protein [Fundidesulfovibrio terrae]|uniref:hypothetical protein n=1 Tax=Fundidesulfovibrio terrae TaxID=2922866 RepID=UPI001FAFFD6E|nr:hypothetical protein [Fundidesulfovibrio terrae]
MNEDTHPEDSQKEKQPAPFFRKFSFTIGDKVDVISANIVCLLFSSGLFWFAYTYDNGALFRILILFGIAAGVVGWATGIALSPYSTDEQSSFANISKAVYGFISGYILSKVDKQINRLFEITTANDFDKEMIIIAVFCTTAFFLAVCTTYVSRSYWHHTRKRAAMT